MIESLIDIALMITRLIDKEMMIRSLAFLAISVISIISLTFLIDRHLYGTLVYSLSNLD